MNETIAQSIKRFKFQLPKDIMASIYKLVAERRDRNQSMRRKRNTRNINLFKDSLDDVEFRRPTLYRNQTFRQRTVSDQQTRQELQVPTLPSIGMRRPTSDVLMINIKNQVKDVDMKIDKLTKRIDELSKCFFKFKSELNKK